MKKHSSGFSLIEVLIVVVILGFVLIGVISFGKKIQTADSIFAQTAETHDRELVLTTRIKKDFEYAGLNLNQAAGESTSGSTTPEFLENPDYQIVPQSFAADISRTTDSGNDYLQSVWALRYGSAAVSFIPAAANSYFGFSNAAGNSFALYLGSAGTWAVFENTTQIFSSSVSGETIASGDLLTIALDNDSDSACSVNYYRRRGEDRRLLFRQTATCADYPYQTYMFLSPGSAVNNFSLTGSWFDKTGTQATNFARLPLKAGAASDVPVWLDEGGTSFTVLASDADIDPLLLLYPVTFQTVSSQKLLTVASPLRGTIKKYDYFLLIDDEAGKSILGYVVSISSDPSGSTVLTFRTNSTSDRAWGEFYSAPDDYLGSTFPPRSRLVRFSEPATYRFISENDDDKNIVVRRSGLSPWEKVAFGLTDFSIFDQTEAGKRSYSVTFSTLPEDDLGVEPHRVVLRLTPSALSQ